MLLRASQLWILGNAVAEVFALSWRGVAGKRDNLFEVSIIFADASDQRRFVWSERDAFTPAAEFSPDVCGVHVCGAFAGCPGIRPGFGEADAPFCECVSFVREW